MDEYETKFLKINCEMIDDFIKKLNLENKGWNKEAVEIGSVASVDLFFYVENEEKLLNKIFDIYDFFLPKQSMDTFSIDLVLDLLYRTDEHAKIFSELEKEYYCKYKIFNKDPKCEFVSHKLFNETVFNDPSYTPIKVNYVTEVWELYDTDLLSKKLDENFKLVILPKVLNRLYLFNFLDIVYKTDANYKISDISRKIFLKNLHDK